MSEVKQMGLTIREQATALNMLCGSKDYNLCPAGFVFVIGCPFEGTECKSVAVEQWVEWLQHKNSVTNNTSELLPCPACGSCGEVCEKGGFAFVLCSAKDCLMSGTHGSTVQQAIEVWNKLPRDLVWTAEPPKKIGHYWCRDKGSSNLSWAPSYIPAVGDLSSYNIEKNERIEWAGPIPTPKEPAL